MTLESDRSAPVHGRAQLTATWLTGPAQLGPFLIDHRLLINKHSGKRSRIAAYASLARWLAGLFRHLTQALRRIRFTCTLTASFIVLMVGVVVNRSSILIAMLALESPSSNLGSGSATSPAPSVDSRRLRQTLSRKIRPGRRRQRPRKNRWAEIEQRKFVGVSAPAASQTANPLPRYGQRPVDADTPRAARGRRPERERHAGWQSAKSMRC